MGSLTRYLSALAERTMNKPPDFVIGRDYLQRWHVIPRNPLCKVYVHRYTGSDDDRALHDHPWPSWSLLVSGRLREQYRQSGRAGEDKSRNIDAGQWTYRGATFAHRLELASDQAVTVFITGPKIRQWGFYCPDSDGYRWVHWKQFTDPTDTGQVGRGCD